MRAPDHIFRTPVRETRSPGGIEPVLVRTFLEEVIGERRFERIADLCDPAVTFSHVNNVGQGIEALREALAEELLAFPDLRVWVTYIVAAGDRAIARMIFRGTFRHSYLGTRATNRRIAYPGFWSFVVRDGRIAEMTLLIDRRVRDEQLGTDLPRRQSWQSASHF